MAMVSSKLEGILSELPINSKAKQLKEEREKEGEGQKLVIFFFLWGQINAVNEAKIN